MSVQSSTRSVLGAATGVELAGEYDERNLAELEAALPCTDDYVFIDLGAVTFMDIACIDVLRRYPRSTLHNVPPMIDRVLTVLDDAFPGRPNTSRA